MEISQSDLRIGDHTVDFTTVLIKEEAGIKSELDLNSTDIGLPEESNCQEENAPIIQTFNSLDPNLNAIQHNESSNMNSILSDSLFDSESMNREIQKRGTFSGNPPIVNYNPSTVTIPIEFLEHLNINIKKEADNSDETYSTEWLCNVNEDPGIKLKITKNIKVEDINISSELNCRNVAFGVEKPKRKEERSECRDRLRKKAERMRERRKQLYETESPEQRLERLAKEAAKRREIRMYYETPDQKRKRLDTEAARKREYRMYNEAPDEKRKRLDREAERRRLKRLNMYANETPDQKRDRLNKESMKRREARLSQYSKETEEQRKERLKRDAIRAREMRFTRSAIETDDERRERLVKDAIRKRELRTQERLSGSNFTELQNVQNLDEMDDSHQIKEEPEDKFNGNYLSNLMIWFRNNLSQQEEGIADPQQSKE